MCANSVRLLAIGGRDRIACTSCEFVHWDNPKPVTATLIPMDGGLVLVRRNVEPFVDDWCLPGGFIEARECPEEAAMREVLEETGLEVQVKSILGAHSPGRGINVIILFYLAEFVGGTMKPGDDASEVRVFKERDLPKNVCFDLHRKMIRKYVEGNGRAP